MGVDDQGEGLLTVDVDLERTSGRGGSGIDETARPGTHSGGISVRVHLGGNGADAQACSCLKADADTVRLVLRVGCAALVAWATGNALGAMDTIPIFSPSTRTAESDQNLPAEFLDEFHQVHLAR